MPPPNDNVASATVLPSNDSGDAVGSNVGATSEAGELYVSGKTVWWKWTAPWTKTYAWRTLYKDGAPVHTNFPTIVRIYDQTRTVIVAQNRRASQWNDQSEVPFLATRGDTYYIQIDSTDATRTGDIYLWWEPFAQLLPNGCEECPPISTNGLIMRYCLPEIDITKEQSLFVDAPKGIYYLQYCAGAWNYGPAPDPSNGWVVSTLPASGVNRDWGTNVPGFFIEGVTSEGKSGFFETFSTRDGWPSAELAQEDFYCHILKLFHNGGNLGLHFSDAFYGDNFKDPGGIPTPIFQLFQIVPQLKPLSASGETQGVFEPGFNGTYGVRFTVQNPTDFDFTGLTVRISGPNITMSGDPNVNQTFPANSAVNQFFGLQITPQNKQDVIATMIISDDFGTEYPSLQFDLTPVPKLAFQQSFRTTVSDKKLVYMQFLADIFGDLSQQPGLPTLGLHATVEQSGGITNLLDLGLNPTSEFDLEPSGLNGLLQCYFTPDDPARQQFTATIHLHDTISGLDYPPVVYTFTPT